MQVAISRLHFPVRSLGPGNRIGVWFQGCSIQCPGCISRDTWEANHGFTSLHEILITMQAWHPMADGLTVSGGEPFDQPEALEALLTSWRSMSGNSVLLFTGYEFSRVSEWLEQRPGLVDAVMAGPYLRHIGQTLALRGSDNQTLHILTETGAIFRSFERQTNEQDRHLDVMFDDDGNAWLAGIPAENFTTELRQLLRINGDQAVTSDQAGASSP